MPDSTFTGCFAFAGSEPIKAEDKYRDGCSVTFDVYLGAKKMRSVSIDLVSDQIECEVFDELVPADRIAVDGILACPYRVYPSDRAVADKLCGIRERHAGKPSSRVKDLVDIAVYALTEDFDADSLRRAVARETSARGIEAPCSFELPSEWGDAQARQYKKAVRGSGIERILPEIDIALGEAKKLLDPVLDGSVSDGSRWRHDEARWL